jgi:GNAT superfamily N-acetyltransferase
MTMDLEQAGLRLDIEDRPADADVEVLPNGLEAFNECRWPGHQKWRPLAVFARDRESIIAGLAGETYSGWLFIEYLWVSDALRGRRIGRALIGAAEGSLSTAAIRPGSTPSASRPRLQSQARLRGVRRAPLSAGLQAHLLSKRLKPAG